jgi:hypothetical protein
MGDIASIYHHTDDPDRSVRSWLVTFLKHQPDPLKPRAGKYRYGIDEFGSPGGRAWVNKRGFLHRVDGPAVESDEGEKGWAREGWKIIRPFPSFPLAFIDSDLVPPESAGTSAGITADGNDG